MKIKTITRLFIRIIRQINAGILPSASFVYFNTFMSKRRMTIFQYYSFKTMGEGKDVDADDH